MKMPKILAWSQYFHDEKQIGPCPGRNMSTTTTEKAWEILSFLLASAAGPKSCKMHENDGKLWKFMEFSAFS